MVKSTVGKVMGVGRAILSGLDRIPKPTPAMGVALLALVMAASGAAVAAIPSSDGTITACRNNKSGELRVINAEDGQTCDSKETQLAWKDGITGKVADSLHADNADLATTADTAKMALDAQNLAGLAPNDYQRRVSGRCAEGSGMQSIAANGSSVVCQEFLAAEGKAADSELLDGKSATNFAAAYKRTVVVSPVGTDAQNGQALFNAFNGITDASATKKYLIYIEPGTYDLGNGTLRMKAHVDIQGGGELNTLITSVVGGCQNGTLHGANNAELRFLTVRNTGTGICNRAIWNNSASPRLNHVTAQAVGVGANDNAGVFNDGGSSLTMTNVTATASGATERNTGVLNSATTDSTMTNVTATASGGNSSTGVSNDGGSSLTMTNVTATASGGGIRSVGVEHWASSANPGQEPLTIRQSKLSGSTNSLALEGDATTKIGLTQLVGPVSKGRGTLQCFNNYNQNMAAVTCP